MSSLNPQDVFPPFEEDTLFAQQTFVIIKGDQHRGTISASFPLTPDGEPDVTRPPMFGGMVGMIVTDQTQRQHAIPLKFQIPALSVREACENFAPAGIKALEDFQSANFRNNLLQPGQLKS